MQNIFRRIKFDLGDSIRIAQGVDLVKVIRGANSPLIEATIKEQLELEKMGVERQPVSRIPNDVGAPGTLGYFENGDDVKPSPAAQLPEPDEDVSEPVPLSKLKTRSQVALSYAGSMALADIAEGDTLAIIKPDCGPRMVKAIKDHIKAGQFKVVKEKRVWFTKERAEEFYQEHKEKAFFDDLIRFMTREDRGNALFALRAGLIYRHFSMCEPVYYAPGSAPCIALHLHKENAVLDWRTMIGPTNSDIARDTAPNSIRAFAGTDGTRNAVHGSDSIAASDRELELIFGAGPELRDLPNVPYPVRRRPDVPPSASEVTLVLVKPDAVAAGKDGEILDVVRARGYDVLQQEKVEISADRARELYREHAQKPFFADLIAHLTSGPVIVAAVKGDDCVHGWREMIGPTDPAEAKIHRPMSIRARYGTDTMRNAVHGSDSPDSAYRELDLIFPDIVKSENIPPPPPNLEYTLALIKPDAMAKGYKDAIIQRIEDAGFNILQEKEVTQPIELAKAFYIEHAGKAFFDDLTTWMSR
ncbi:MAG: nucleoside diphosphate kinase [Olpidium bornovanus]|uniref:Nucleoside diphosphate kinase n=1 Tax=Olpidium bornovanus TaxID=278681 RepID=A0A8H7ZT49_9FUNG|nr:MAG: nucleoside diphosphate kinase [Olpidium bornovanus]